MSIEKEIRDQIENIKKLKMEVGNINNHLSALEGMCRGDMQKQVEEAYQRGINDGSLDVKQRVEGAYQRGLEDAWEAARKLFSSMAVSDIGKVFHTEWNNGGFNALINLQPQEVIAKLKAYEEHKDDSIKVGDEVEVINSGNKYIIAWIHGSLLCGFAHDGLTCRLGPKDVRKTGRHFEISPILKAMKNG